MITKKKNTRILYKDTKHIRMWETLPADDCKELLLALLQYEPGVDMSDCFSNPSTYALFCMEAEQIDENEKKYQEVSETKRQAANKRWNKEQPNTEFEVQVPVPAPAEVDKVDKVNCKQIIEDYFNTNGVVFEKDVNILDVHFDYYIPSSKFAIIIKYGHGYKKWFKKAKKITKKTDMVRKVVGFNPRLKDNLDRAFEGCSITYIKTGVKSKHQTTLRTEQLSIWDYKFAKEAIENPTDEEVMAMRLLEYNKIPYEFQKPLVINGHHYRPDFIINDKIILEIDGGYHQTPDQVKKDSFRDKQLKSVGFEVIRRSNEEVREQYSKLPA